MACGRSGRSGVTKLLQASLEPCRSILALSFQVHERGRVSIAPRVVDVDQPLSFRSGKSLQASAEIGTKNIKDSFVHQGLRQVRTAVAGRRPPVDHSGETPLVQASEVVLPVRPPCEVVVDEISLSNRSQVRDTCRSRLTALAHAWRIEAGGTGQRDAALVVFKGDGWPTGRRRGSVGRPGFRPGRLFAHSPLASVEWGAVRLGPVKHWKPRRRRPDRRPPASSCGPPGDSGAIRVPACARA